MDYGEQIAKQQAYLGSFGAAEAPVSPLTNTLARSHELAQALYGLASDIDDRINGSRPQPVPPVPDISNKVSGLNEAAGQLEAMLHRVLGRLQSALGAL